MKAVLGVVLVLAFVASAASATITFDQLDDDIFVISHRVKIIGSRGQAMRLAYEKVASVCVAAGFTHYKILEEDSQASQQYESANASVRAQFFFADGEGRIDCARNANAEYVAQAKKKLEKRGYVPMEPPATAADAGAGEAATGEAAEDEEGEAASGNASCTAEQIAVMAKAGLTAEQIQAACPDHE
jgi:hypothetical protein